MRMKELARFIGKVTKLNIHPEESYVSMRELPNGISQTLTATTNNLTIRNIGDGDEFEIIIYEKDGKYVPDMKRIDPKPPQFIDNGSEI